MVSGSTCGEGGARAAQGGDAPAVTGERQRAHGYSSGTGSTPRETGKLEVVCGGGLAAGLYGDESARIRGGSWGILVNTR